VKTRFQSLPFKSCNLRRYTPVPAYVPDPLDEKIQKERDAAKAGLCTI
jgi:hypothetical protein